MKVPVTTISSPPLSAPSEAVWPISLGSGAGWPWAAELALAYIRAKKAVDESMDDRFMISPNYEIFRLNILLISAVEIVLFLRIGRSIEARRMI
jgi:hypothetical protein